MVNKIIREIDNKGRIILPYDLLKLAKVEKGEELAICSFGKAMIKLKKIHQLENCQVIAVQKIDTQGRFLIQQEIREETTKFEVFLFNQDLIIKEA